MLYYSTIQLLLHNNILIFDNVSYVIAKLMIIQHALPFESKKITALKIVVTNDNERATSTVNAGVSSKVDSCYVC